MTFFIHEFTHTILSLFVVYVVWKRYQKLIPTLIVSVLGGVLVDLDHFFDYFLAFGFKFSPNYFLKGYQFLKTDKIYIPLHSVELVIILTLLAIVLKNKTIKSLFLAFTLALFLHILVDIPTNNMHFKSYFISYRIVKNFQLKTMVAPTHYQNHLELKRRVRFD